MCISFENEPQSPLGAGPREAQFPLEVSKRSGEQRLFETELATRASLHRQTGLTGGHRRSLSMVQKAVADLPLASAA